MKIKNFALKVQKAVAERVGEEYRVEVQEVHKNNNVMLQGLLIHAKDKNVSPTIYLNSFWDAYEKGIPFAVIIERIMRIYEEDTPKENVDMSFFKDFEQVKERICYRLISAERNQELLSKIPHMEYLDLAICFYYSYQGEALGSGSILIYDSHMKMWDTTTEELYELAQQNTSRLFPDEWNAMETIIRELMAEQGEEVAELFPDEEEEAEFFEQLPMLILSNENRVYGASCLLYPGVLSTLADSRGQNLYIIPSSIHEVIVLPDSGKENADRLRRMIAEVNTTQVEPEEILSDNLYYYDRLLKQIKIV